MHNLNRAAGIPKEYLSDIVNGKVGDRGTRLTNMLPKIENRYSALEAAYTSVGIGGIAQSAWSVAERDDMLHCYEATTKALKKLKEIISKSQPDEIRDICPYCGIGGPGQFDHYLPKEKFPEFSVNSLNLVPCCGVCNGKKSDFWQNPGSPREFINFYLDSLPAAPMINITVQWKIKKGKLVPISTFDLVCPTGFGVNEFQLVSNHFQKLGLLGRYKDQAHTEFLSIRNSALAREARTIKTLREFLLRFITNWENTLGPLNWRIVLYRALTAYTPFLQSCLKK